MWPAIIGAAGSVGSGILNLIGQSQQMQRQDRALDIQEENLIAQQMLARKQLELATASRTDARGNTVLYIPGQGWITHLSPDSASTVKMSDDLERKQMIRALTTGQADESRNFNRRLQEGAAADEFMGGLKFGMPDRDVVRGRRTISNVTQAAEGADLAKNAVTGAALRTGASSGPVTQNVGTLNRAGAAGVRTALARSDDEADPLFTTMLQNAQKSKLDPYNMLASRASNSSGMAFKPENVSAGVDASLGTAAGVGAMRGAWAPGLGEASKGIAATLLGTRGPNYDTFVGGLTEQLLKFFEKDGKKGSSTVPTYDTGPGTGYTY